MSACLKNEQLQAFVDGELGAPEEESAAGHMSGCSDCAAKLEAIRALSVKLTSALDSLLPEPFSVSDSPGVLPQSQPSYGIGWAAVAAVASLAAIILLALLLARKGPVEPNAPDLAVVAPPPAVVTSVVNSPAAVNHPSARSHKPKPQLKTLQFHALDDGGPIETGLIYRVSLPVPAIGNASGANSTRTIPAEVIVDEAGQVRAIRFLQ